MGGSPFASDGIACPGLTLRSVDGEAVTLDVELPGPHGRPGVVVKIWRGSGGAAPAPYREFELSRESASAARDAPIAFQDTEAPRGQVIDYFVVTSADPWCRATEGIALRPPPTPTFPGQLVVRSVGKGAVVDWPAQAEEGRVDYVLHRRSLADGGEPEVIDESWSSGEPWVDLGLAPGAYAYSVTPLGYIPSAPPRGLYVVGKRSAETYAVIR